MNYWLMKSEPEAFSINDLRQQGVAGWDGVRNYQARNFMRAMRKGDRALFYHSNAKPPAVVGMMEIVREAYPDPTQFDEKNEHFDAGSQPAHPRWDQVDVKFVDIFQKPLTLDAIRGIPALQDMVLLKRGRLSVQPVTVLQWKTLLKKVTGVATAVFILIAFCVPVPAQAICRYFRVSYRLTKCKDVPPSELKEVDRSDLQLPDLEEASTPDGKLVRVRCNCNYTLSGSDPRCDFDRSDEQESVISLEKGAAQCKKNKSLCQTICPETVGY